LSPFQNGIATEDQIIPDRSGHLVAVTGKVLLERDAVPRADRFPGDANLHAASGLPFCQTIKKAAALCGLSTCQKCASVKSRRG
jgi:hypothetical protein